MNKCTALTKFSFQINDWTLECAEIDEVHYSTSAVARRALNTHDRDKLGYTEDRDFRPGPLAVIFAWGPYSLLYHGARRGNIDISFIQNQSTFEPPLGI